MRIAFFGIKRLPATAGADRVVEHLLAHLPPAHEYYVYVLKERTGTTPLCMGNVHHIPLPALPGKHLRPVSYFLLCSLHFHLKGRFDLVHAHNSDIGLFCAILRLRPGTKILGTFHGRPYLRQKWGLLARVFLRLSELYFAAFCQALTTVAPVERPLPWPFGRKQVVNIPNGVEPHWDGEPEVGPDYPSLGVRRGDYLLFACGRLDATKGLHHLLDAFLRDPTGQKLLVVGDFSHDRRYAQQIDQRCSSHPEIILHRSLLPLDSLIDLIRHCKVFIFPSEVEAMSMMLLEVVSCKKLVVCSDIRENLAVVGEDYPYRFASGNPADLAAKLRAAVLDPDPLHTMEPVYARCMATFSWESIARSYVALYESLAAGPQALDRHSSRPSAAPPR